jgi:glycosyltransferase involved in cell wall biosynthesis
VKQSSNQLLFLTNIINPYQLDLFDALSEYFNLSVIYFSKSESNRSWKLEPKSGSYHSLVLSSGIFNRCLSWLTPDLYFQPSLLPKLLAFQGDNVVISGSYYSPNTWMALLIFKIKGKKVYWMGEQIKSSTITYKNSLKKFFLLPFFSFIDGVMAVGQVAIKSYRSYGYKGPIESIFYSININRFNDVKVLKRNEPLKVVMPGSLIPRKGMDVGLLAFLKARESFKQECELRVIGDGPLMESLIDQYKKYPNIHFLGFLQQEEVDREFMGADIFMFCTRYDGWGVVVNEAIAAGLPVIVSDACGSSELIQDEGGYVCRNEDVPSFTNALVHLVNDSSARASMAHHHSVLKSEIDSSAMAKRIHSFIL